MRVRPRLDGLVALGLSGLLAFSLVGLPLAMLGAFRRVPVVGGSVVLWAGIWLVWRRGKIRPGPTSAGAALVALIAAAGFAGFNAHYSSQHVLTERDPAVYNTTGRWLADHGKLLIDAGQEPYTGLRDRGRVHFASAGYYETSRTPHGELYAQFAHLFPSILAASAWIGGSGGMLKVNALLGGFALIVLFVFASRIMSPWAAAAAVVALAVNPIEAHFSRDAYTEITTQVLLLGALWALSVARDELDPGKAAVAGLLWGATCMARIDAFAFLIPLIGYVFYELWTGADAPSNARHLAFLGSLSVGAAAGVAVGIADLYFFSPVYLHDLFFLVARIIAGVLFVTVAGAALLALRGRFAGVRAWADARRAPLAAAAVVVIAAGAVYAYFVRPHVEVGLQKTVNTLVEEVQRREGLVPNGRRTYAELSMHWLALYLGIPALFGGVAGAALMIRETIFGRLRRAVPFLLLFGLISALYLWTPEITPDHIWAMRRFLPMTIPGFVVCSFWVIDRAWRTGDGALRFVNKAAAVAAGAAVIGFPAWVLRPIASEEMQHGALSATQVVCDRLPPKSAVIIAQRDNLDGLFTQTVRSFCDVPSASVPVDEPLSWYRDIAKRWAAAGRPLYAISSRPNFGPRWPIHEHPAVAIEYRNLERVVIGRPRGYESYPLILYVVRVPVS